MRQRYPVGSARVRLRPFRGLRYDPDRVDLAAVTAEPPDPSDTLQIAAALSRDEHNVTWLLDPLLAGASSPDDAEAVSRRLKSWRISGIVRHDDQPAMYAYQYRRGDRSLLGLVAAISLHDPGEKRVLAHEQVSIEAVERHVTLLAATDAQPEPVVLIHHSSARYREQLHAVVAETPTVSFRLGDADGGAEHSLWQLSDPKQVAELAVEVATEQLLIADGHHRYTAFRHCRDHAFRSAGARRPWDFGLAMLVDAADEGLSVGSIHRVVRNVTWADIRSTPGLTMSPVTEGSVAATASQPAHQCVVTDGQHWVQLAATGHPVTAAVGASSLAVHHLHASWLRHWGAGEADIDYVRDAARAVDYARRSNSLAILLPAPPLDVVFAAARAGTLLPAKTTSFGPKPRIGMVLRYWPAGLDDLPTSDSSLSHVTTAAAGGVPG